MATASPVSIIEPADENLQHNNVSKKRRISQELGLPRKKPIASVQNDQSHFQSLQLSGRCQPCHARKVKCSGDKPCSRCVRSHCIEQCVYPIRHQKITLTASEIDRLVNERVQSQQHRSQSNDGEEHDPTTEVTTSGPVRTTVSAAERSSLTSALNPMLGERSWFEPLKSVEMPIHVGEAADAAFATRLRQAIVSPSSSVQHLPRTHYVSDAKVVELSDAACVWPPLARARLLVKVALDTVGQIYHCVRESEIYDGLKQHYRNQPVRGPFFTCKLLALFALGEIYSCRTQNFSEDNFPGLAYFARSSRILRGCSERPQIDTLECLLLLSIVSLAFNRRHTSYHLASSAVRQAIIMGVHHNVPEQLLPDRAVREHRLRVWWTAYLLDRLLASKMGHPPSVSDDDIDIDMPSDRGIPEQHKQDFFDAEYLVATIKLAQISREIITSIYGRKTVHVAFSRRVQKALKDLRSWVEELPKHLQISTDDGVRPLARPVKWLHLSFNQYVIVATRPILLHILRSHTDLWSRPIKSAELKGVVGETPLALAEACIRSARHSNRLLTESWIDGSFATFDYTYTQYLFSSATILAISSISIGKSTESDAENFTTACEWLDQLSQNGNFAATEFSRHLNATADAINSFNGGSIRSSNDMVSGTLANNTFGATVDPSPAASANFQSMTTEMALAEPSLQDFLSQADLDMSFFDTQMQDNQFQSLYFPLLPDEAWKVG